MLKSIIKYSFIFLVSVLVVYQFNDTIAQLRHFAKNFDGRLFTAKDDSIYITSDSGEVYKVNFKFKKE
tara:strand:+ start:130 stop:333 length:204 start_codon:yes stop_codon:yes gene_type:complete